MGKRSQFERKPRDSYDTPVEALLPLLPHLPKQARFIEPCAGTGQLARHLWERGFRCVHLSDIAPRAERLHERTMHPNPPIEKADATRADYPLADMFITNPPWDRPLLHAIILNLYWRAPTWLLLDADWMHTRQARAFMPLIAKIVSIGRVKWQPDSPHTGKDNAAWYLFQAPERATEFVGRQA